MGAGDCDRLRWSGRGSEAATYIRVNFCCMSDTIAIMSLDELRSIAHYATVVHFRIVSMVLACFVRTA